MAWKINQSKWGNKLSLYFLNWVVLVFDFYREFVVHVVKNLGMSLKHGSTFIYQSLPRLLSLWMDFGTAVIEQEKRDKNRQSQTLQKNRNNLVKLNNVSNQFSICFLQTICSRSFNFRSRLVNSSFYNYKNRNQFWNTVKIWRLHSIQAIHDLIIFRLGGRI